MIPILQTFNIKWIALSSAISSPKLAPNFDIYNSPERCFRKRELLPLENSTKSAFEMKRSLGIEQRSLICSISSKIPKFNSQWYWERYTHTHTHEHCSARWETSCSRGKTKMGNETFRGTPPCWQNFSPNNNSSRDKSLSLFGPEIALTNSINLFVRLFGQCPQCRNKAN